MDFTYDDEQDALRDAVRGLIGKTYSDYETRRQTTKTDPGFDEKVWTQLAEMGLLGLPFSEDDGGVGAGPVEIGIVCQELGRVIAPEPFLGSVVLAGGLVSAVGTPEQRQEILGALSAGDSVPAFAHAEPGSRWSDSACAVTATQDGDAWTVSGAKDGVLHGARADVLIVSAALPEGGTGLFVVAGDALSSVERVGYSTYDGGRAARITFDATAATPLGAPGADVTASIAVVHDITRIMAANQSLGAMQTLLKATTEYLKSRKQFGVTLNTFQALTFRAADMYTSQELTHSLVDWATMVVAAGKPAAVADAAARVGLQVSRGGRHVGQEAIQLHGGIGMTAEYSVGMYMAHLTVLDHLFGDAGRHLKVLDGVLYEHDVIDPLDAGRTA